MKLKKIGIILLVICLMFTFSGCSFITSDTDSLLMAPKPTGELYYIQQALENSITGEYTLKYPTDGDYRSAIVQKDLNSDGTKEAIAFYSTVTDNVVTMHINIISNRENKWVSVGDFKCVASGVELVSFSDMDADGILEIIVGWTVYGTVDKSIGVYSIKNKIFVQRLIENYTHYMCDDFNADGRDDLFLVYLNSKEQASTAKMFTLAHDTVTEMGNCRLDGSVTGYYAPVLSTISTGQPAIYLDAVKGSGLITEILTVENNVMRNALINENGAQTVSTYRNSTVSVRDIDGDGVCEIPMPVLLTQSNANSADNVYKTEWYAYDGKAFNLKFAALMNYTDGYFIKIPQKLDGKITVSRDTATRTRTIMRIDAETGNSAEMLFRIQAVPVSADIAYIENPYVSFEVARTDECYYVATIGSYIGEEAVTADEIKSLFNILK